MKLINAIILKTLSVFSQTFWEKVYRLSLLQMNFGYGGDFRKSGELYVCKLISNKLQKEKELVIFDVGANRGNYAKALTGVFGQRATIHSFEPSKKTFELFKETTKDLINVIPNNFGFSDRDSKMSLYSNYEGSGLASVYQRNLDYAGVNLASSEEIVLTTLDGYCRNKSIEHIHFLKLDVEGHELSALKGATEMINKQRVDFIQFEFGSCNIDSRTYLRDFYYLLRENFNLYRILENGIHKLPNYSETQEIFVTINYLAVRKTFLL